MSKDAPTVAAELSVQERVLLFCVASETEWERAGVTRSAVASMIVRGLIQRDPVGRLSRTKEGRATLDALLLRGAAEHSDAPLGPAKLVLKPAR
jgi:hypothetical protein